MLVSSIRVGLRCWYRVFGLGQNVDTETRPNDQSKIVNATLSYLNMLKDLFISLLIVLRIMRSPIINI